MSTDIQTGKIPASISNPGTAKSSLQDRSAGTVKSAGTGQTTTADTVSMTDQAARLQQFEAKLAEVPHVNPQLVNEMKLAIAEGSLDMDFEGTAAKLIEIEGANSEGSDS